MPDRRFEYAELLRTRNLPPPEPETMQGLADIVDEGVLGASNHVALALPLVARAARAARESALTEALELARFIARVRGVGAPIVANALAWQIDGVEGLARQQASELLEERARDWDIAAADRRRALIEKAAAALSDCSAPLIFDYSSTVADVVKACAQARGLARLVIPESRAIDGGRRYMAALADLGVPILFVPDAAVEYAVAQSDAVLLGAESVTLDGGISNTIGSIAAARAGRARGIGVFGAADLFKVGPRRADESPAPTLRSYDFLLRPGEVASTEAPELEIVPPELVTAILTERGAVPPADLPGAMARRNA